MKKDEREIYSILAAEIDAGLGAFCKYAYYSGSNCCECYVECEHPLQDKLPAYGDCECACPNTDCWGFRPKLPVSDIADIVGIVLAEGFLDWSWRYDSDQGLILVSGTRKKVGQDALPPRIADRRSDSEKAAST